MILNYFPSSFFTTSFKAHLLNSAVLVTTVTRTADRLKPALRGLFPSELFLTPTPEEYVSKYARDLLEGREFDVSGEEKISSLFDDGIGSVDRDSSSDVCVLKNDGYHSIEKISGNGCKLGASLTPTSTHDEKDKLMKNLIKVSEQPNPKQITSNPFFNSYSPYSVTIFGSHTCIFYVNYVR